MKFIHSKSLPLSSFCMYKGRLSVPGAFEISIYVARALELFEASHMKRRVDQSGCDIANFIPAQRIGKTLQVRARLL
jgi:hypothetical protein